MPSGAHTRAAPSGPERRSEQVERPEAPHSNREGRATRPMWKSLAFLCLKISCMSSYQFTNA